MRTIVVLLPLCAGLLAPAGAGAQAVPSAQQQVQAAIQPLPPEFRDGARVLGYAQAGGRLTELRRGAGPFTCLADNPAEARFHVACYHESLEPFMARGRELRAAGVTNVDSVRYAEIDAGRLAMPRHPAALYSLTAESGAPDPATGMVAGTRPLYVVYVAFATAESTGLPVKPQPNAPWLMLPGTAKAHIMFVPGM
jgi:hypothetical protein